MKGYSVLIVDDDELVHEVLSEYLKMAGFTVISAFDGQQALHTVQRQPVDLLLLDIQMPVMDGFKTLEALSRLDKFADIPVILCSSLDRENLKVKGLELGAVDYVVKPYSKAELLARVRSAIRRGGRYRRTESAFRGALEHISLADLLQTLELGQKTATVNLSEIGGKICVESGMLVYAAQGAFRGMDAVKRIFLLEGGSFEMDFTPLPAEHERDPMRTQNVLMETVAYVDELNLMIREIGSPETPVLVRGSKRGDIAAVAGAKPMALRKLISLLAGDLKEGVLAVAGDISDGKIELLRA